MLNLRCIMTGLLILTVVAFYGCSKSGSSSPEGQNTVDEHWYGAIDASAVWIDIDNDCNRRIEVAKEIADSVCQSLGFVQAAGFDPQNCWVGGTQGLYLECVACTYQD